MKKMCKECKGVYEKEYERCPNLLCNCAPLVAVDDAIVWPIEQLWRLGYKTLYSCGGHPIPNHGGNGYIVFDCSNVSYFDEFHRAIKSYTKDPSGVYRTRDHLEIEFDITGKKMTLRMNWGDYDQWLESLQFLSELASNARKAPRVYNQDDFLETLLEQVPLLMEESLEALGSACYIPIYHFQLAMPGQKQSALMRITSDGVVGDWPIKSADRDDEYEMCPILRFRSGENKTEIVKSIVRCIYKITGNQPYLDFWYLRNTLSVNFENPDLIDSYYKNALIFDKPEQE